MIRLIQINPYLTYLELFQSGMTNQDVDSLMSLLHLKDLSLKGNNISDQGAIKLAAHPTIVSLKLWKNSIGVEGARALSHNQVLRKL
jgi:hypothetical protein